MSELRLDPAPGLAVSWSAEALDALRRDGATADAWHLEGALAPVHSALRVLTAALDDGTALLVAAARPAGATGHDAEHVAGLLVGAETQPERLAEVLLSTEYAADGAIRRVGLELYRTGEDYPLRAAGNARTATRGAESGEVDRAALSFRMGGRSGSAVYEVVHTG